MYYEGTLKEIEAIEAQICVNAELPNDKGTVRWAEPLETINGYAIPAPINGWGGYTFEQMTHGIAHNITESVEFITYE